MIITYQGVESFRISHGDLTIAVNPISKDSNFKPKNAGADITLITTNHEDLNGRDTTSRGDTESFVISGPGEYEVKDVVIQGFLSESHYAVRGLSSAKATEEQGPKKMNTIYQISFEGMNLCFLGALSDEKLSSETYEALDDIDILFVPIGGEGVLDAARAYKLAVSLEPSVIIPMHYGEVGEKDALKKFLKEGGEEKGDAIDKLVVKKKDLDGKEAEIIVLKEE